MTWRTNPDGSLVAPRRGRKPPEPPEGYYADPKSGGFVCRPILCECNYRKITNAGKTACCPSSSDRMICEVINQTVYHKDCKECGGNQEWPIQVKLNGKSITGSMSKDTIATT